MKLSLLLFLGIPVWAAADVSGTWEMIFRGGQIYDANRVQVALKDGKFVFKASGMEFSGTPEAERIRFACLEDGRRCGTFTVTVSGDTLSGTGDLEGIPMELTARRPAVRPGTAPVRHEFVPAAYYRYFSAETAPALRIFPGDTVHTATVDAGGRDLKGERRVFGGNPLNGPFYVEGAMPGDVLAVKLTRVRLNRDSAQSGDRVVPSALEPGMLRDQPKVDNFDSTWALDRRRARAV